MNKTVFLLMMGLLAVGCAGRLDSVRKTNRQNLLKLSVGMTRDEALTIMGDARGGGRFGEPTVNSPYKSEILQGPEKTVEVVYYYTDIKDAIYTAHEVTITDDELTPLVFEDARLVGWGNSFLESNINKYRIRPSR